jgi:prepilin-type N-terminal cleavage/methylation domain-containing protein
MKIFNIKNNKESGFTLVETLVAVAIFATSIAGLISITARGINDNVFVKNKLIAGYLAQEGVELVRNMRDTAVLPENNIPWQIFLQDENNWVGNCYDDLPGINACYIDGSISELSALPCDENGTCPKLRFDSQTSRYTYSVITDSNFTRTITIRPIENGNNEEVIVNSIVEWTQGSNTHQVSYQYNLFNWFDPS